MSPKCLPGLAVQTVVGCVGAPGNHYAARNGGSRTDAHAEAGAVLAQGGSPDELARGCVHRIEVRAICGATSYVHAPTGDTWRARRRSRTYPDVNLPARNELADVIARQNGFRRI